MQVLVGGQVACVHVFLLLQLLCLKLLGFFFYPKVDLYLVTVRIHLTPTPRVYHDEGFWFPLY